MSNKKLSTKGLTTVVSKTARMAEALSGDFAYRRLDMLVLRKMYKEGYSAKVLSAFFWNVDQHDVLRT